MLIYISPAAVGRQAAGAPSGCLFRYVVELWEGRRLQPGPIFDRVKILPPISAMSLAQNGLDRPVSYLACGEICSSLQAQRAADLAAAGVLHAESACFRRGS